MDDAGDAAVRQVGGDDAITTKIGAVVLPIGVVLIAISEVFHPSGEDPMDFPAVFREYASSDVWTTVHFGEYFGFLFLLGGLVALYYSVSARPGLGAGLAPFGLGRGGDHGGLLHRPPGRRWRDAQVRGPQLDECSGSS